MLVGARARAQTAGERSNAGTSAHGSVPSAACCCPTGAPSAGTMRCHSSNMGSPSNPYTRNSARQPTASITNGLTSRPRIVPLPPGSGGRAGRLTRRGHGGVRTSQLTDAPVEACEGSADRLRAALNWHVLRQQCGHRRQHHPWAERGHARISPAQPRPTRRRRRSSGWGAPGPAAHPRQAPPARARRRTEAATGLRLPPARAAGRPRARRIGRWRRFKLRGAGKLRPGCRGAHRAPRRWTAPTALARWRWRTRPARRR